MCRENSELFMVRKLSFSFYLLSVQLALKSPELIAKCIASTHHSESY